MADMPSEVFSERYELVRHIARGGMAQVYLAQDLLLVRPVAIKVLFPELSSDPAFVERFRREAQAAANLSHANIVSIYDWGQGEHTYFIVMEYIDGQTLSWRIRQGALAPTRAAAIGADVASALHFAHRRGVIHRDVKPGNVLIDHNGRVKVADFGIARAVSQAGEGLTQTGAVMGTASYFSPEQAQGQAVDARSDVYSLGVVLYEMVTGRTPFTGDSPVAIAYKHVREYPELPSTINPSVPPEFEAIVMMAMAKNPEDRYQSAAELRDDLTRFSQGRPVAALPPSLGTPATRAVAGPPAYPPGYDLTHAPQDTRLVGQSGTVLAAGAAAEPQRSRAGWWAALFVVLLAVLGGVVYFIGQNANWWGTPATIPVPYLKGDPEAQAQSILKAKGFKHVQLQDGPSGLVPHGQVIGTNPGAGSAVPPNHTVYLNVSTGAPMAAIPTGLIGKSCGTAATTLNSANFKVKNVPQNSNSIVSGLVISTQPPGGQRYQQGDTVKVICSAGQQQTVVPDLQGLSAAVAGARLQADHLRVGNSATVASATIKAGLVAYTAPAGGSAQPWGTVVTLYISGGQETVPVPSDLVGETLQQAQKELQTSQLYNTVHYQPITNPSQDGYVISTNPKPGASVKQNSTVTLYIGEYTGPTTTTTVATTTTATTAPVTTTTRPTTTTAGSTTTTSAVTTTTAPATTTTSPVTTTSAAAAATTTTAAATAATSPSVTPVTPVTSTTTPVPGSTGGGAPGTGG
jgi:eukaryotic-like serine/threonine-protein kinase